MESTLDFIKSKYDLSFNSKMPITLNRFYRQKHLTGLFKDLGFKKGVEVGTEKGGFAEQLCQKIPILELFCVDPYQAYDEEPNQYVMDDYYQQALDKLSGYNCKLIRKSSEDAAKDFEPDSMDFVFIDGAHDFDNVMKDIIAWNSIVRPGGILAGHDYYSGVINGNLFQVPEAVQSYAASHDVKPWFILHANNSMDCWMWVKP